MIRGTNYEQDSRFSDKSKRMLEQSKWPDKYETKIDMEKAHIQLCRSTLE